MLKPKVLYSLICVCFTMIISACSTNFMEGIDQGFDGNTLNPIGEDALPEDTLESPTAESPTTTITIFPSATQPIIPTDTLIPTTIADNEPENILDTQNYRFQRQPGSPVYMPNIFHSEVGCNWLGIGGQVFDEASRPVTQDIVVEAGGVLEGNSVIGITLTGLAPDYGEGGYEIVLSDHGIDSTGTLWVQLSDLTGNKLSPQIYVDTYDACDKNLILLNFVKYYEDDRFKYYMPFIGQDGDQ